MTDDTTHPEEALPEPIHSRCKAASGGARCVKHCGDPICIAPADVDAVVRARLASSIAWLMNGKTPGPAGYIGVGDMRWLISALDERDVARVERDAARTEVQGLRTGLEQATTALRALGNRSTSTVLKPTTEGEQS